jgi:hypothetical protein
MFKLYDYVIVVCVLVVSLSVGFVPRLLKLLRIRPAKKGGNNASNSSSTATHHVITNDDYEDEFSTHYISGLNKKASGALEADASKKQKPHFLMNSISFVVSFQTTVSIIGLPIEYYYYGFKTTQFLFSFLLGPFIIAGLFVPFLFKIKSKSIYEYLDDKFEGYKTVKNFTLFMIMVYQFLLASLVLLSAGITIAQIVSSNYQLSLWPIVLVLGLISSSLALLGFHSVVWLNFIQYLIMVACNLTIIYLGIKHFTYEQISSQTSSTNRSTSVADSEFVEGLSRVWSSTVESGRSRLFVFDENLRYRFTFWNGLIGTTFNLIPTYALTQQSYMRIKSCKSVNSARLLVLTMIPFGIINLLLIILLGFVMYAYFHVCGDPASAGLVKNQNQIFTKFLTQFFGQYNGLLGVYIALIISNSISTLANTLKALSVILSEDIFIRLIKNYKNELNTSAKNSNGLSNSILNGSGGSNKLTKENSIYRLRRLSEKNAELSYEEELLTFEYHSNFKRQHKKLVKNYKNTMNKEKLIKKRLNVTLILVCSLIIVAISLTLEMAPNTLTSTSFSLLNATHGPVLFVYLCAMFNGRQMNNSKYTSIRTGAQARYVAFADFRLKHYEVVISCILAIMVIEFMFIGQISTFKQAKEFYNFEKYPISRVENPNEQLLEFCQYEENHLKYMPSTLAESKRVEKNNDHQIEYLHSSKNNTKNTIHHVIEQESNNINFLNYLFATSFNWYPLIGFLVCLISQFFLTLLRVTSRHLFFRFFKLST